MNMVPVPLLLVSTLLAGGIPVAEGFGQPIGMSVKNIHQSNLHKSDVVPTQLSYRSHNNPEEQQCQHDQATADLAWKQRPKHIVSSTVHTWWTAAKSRRALKQAEADEIERKAQKEQLILDQYLESLDRRYKRVHKDELKTADRGGVSSLMDWLTNGETSVSSIEEQRKREDAIYVFGLAEVASKNLLRRHHLPIPESKRISQLDNSAVIDIVESTATPENFLIKDASGIDSVISSPGKSSLMKSKSDYSRSALGMVVFCIQLLRTIQASYCQRISTITTIAASISLACTQSCGKIACNGVSLLANFITMNGGSKYVIHFASIFIASLASSALSIVRPFTKAA